ncbi:MAG TPA: DUF547 domain-containing protein, partial [Thermoanaerobaculia bacterium]
MNLKNLTLASALLGLLLAALPAAAVNPPDYKLWGDLLSKYYDPAKGMDYKGLKANDKKTLDELRNQMAQVDVGALPRTDQLAYWINLYNISVVNVVVEHYPVASIRDISTDFIAHLNVFKKPAAKTRTGMLSLEDIENDKIREGFKDPRIHFAINCAAKSCPPIRPEPYEGAKVNDQLDDQVRKFLNGPHGIRLAKDGGELVVHTTKIMDWFSKDFNNWGGGQIAFIIRYVSSDKRKQIETAGN